MGLFMLRPIRRIVQKMYHQPGNGPDVERLKKNYFECHALAQPDYTGLSTEGEGGSGDRPSPVKVRMRFNEDAYLFTGVTLGEAALTILKYPDTEAHGIGGGVLTSATLGHALWIGCELLA
jgi:hypothetical protein